MFVFVSYAIEPFLQTAFSSASEGSSAWPPSRERVLLPTNLYWAWGPAEADPLVYDAVLASAERLTRLAEAEGQDIADAALYGNYAIASTPVERLYGDNLDRMLAIKQKYDPANVMGLAGGWKV